MNPEVSERQIRERLLAAEPLSQNRQQRLEREIMETLNPRLSGFAWWYRLSGALGSAMSVVVACIVLRYGTNDTTDRVIWSVAAATSFVGIFLFAKGLRSGRENVPWLAALSKAAPALALLILIGLMMNVLAHPTISNLAWLVFGVVLLVLTLAIVLFNFILLIHLGQKEQVLRLEYRLAELKEVPEK
jgi:tellurite resistance protein TehA-like permease